MNRMEVRCCCTPNKLLGTLPVPDAASLGGFVKFALMKPRTRALAAFKGKLLTFDSYQHITFQLQHWRALEMDTSPDLPGDRSIEYPGLVRRSGIALKREGVTIEQLRLIPGFIEATP